MIKTIYIFYAIILNVFTFIVVKAMKSLQICDDSEKLLNRAAFFGVYSIDLVLTLMIINEIVSDI